MNYYKLLKLNTLIKNPRIKLMGLYFLHILNKRYLAVHFDPVNACNLRCKMCYFTDEEYVKKLKGVFNPNDIPLLSKAILKKALKLQIGCGTEPTLYKHLNLIFEEASKAKVPFISLTTNANILKKEDLNNWAENGLNEITISLHGVFKKTYEHMMGKGNYSLFLQSLSYISEVKQKYPNLKLRVNYTFNEDNFDELGHFWDVFNEYSIDTLQIRPIQKLGNTTYSNFDLGNIIPKYENLFKILQQECSKRNTTLIAPNKSQLKLKKSVNSIITPFTYCYISPNYFWRNDFDWKKETFNMYSKRTNWSRKLIQTAFTSKKKLDKLKKKNLNYNLS